MTTHAVSCARFGRGVCAVGLVLALCGAAAAADAPKSDAPPPAPHEGAWVNVTGNVGGDTWGYAGVCAIACVPGADAVLAGVSERGLWSSTDGGATWKPLGAEAKSAKITHRPYDILFDPQDPKVFWVSGNYGPGLFKTTDGGQTFERLGMLGNLDGLAIDFADPDRKTMLVGMHEKIQSVFRSVDGGKIWINVGKNLPDKSNHSTNPLVLGPKTHLVNTAGWLQGHFHAIFRTEDGGTTWTKVSDVGAAGHPLVASDGAIYWPQIWERGLLKSTDQGKTWTKLDGVVKRTPIELAGGRLVAPAAAQLHLSTDGAKTWKPVGPACPFAPSVVAYSAKRNCFYISRSSDKKIADAIARYDLAGSLEAALPRKLVVWDGETAGANAGKAWTGAEGPGATLKVQDAEVHSGTAALEFHCQGKGWRSSGWNWRSWWPKDSGDDITGFRNLTFWVKVVGEAKPKAATVSVSLACSGEGAKPTGQAGVAKYTKDLFDGQWHEVTIPLPDLYQDKTGFNPKKAWEFGIGVSSQEEAKFSVCFDDIGFDDRPVEPAK